MRGKLMTAPDWMFSSDRILERTKRKDTDLAAVEGSDNDLSTEDEEDNNKAYLKTSTHRGLVRQLSESQIVIGNLEKLLKESSEICGGSVATDVEDSSGSGALSDDSFDDEKNSLFNGHPMVSNDSKHKSSRRSKPDNSKSARKKACSNNTKEKKSKQKSTHHHSSHRKSVKSQDPIEKKEKQYRKSSLSLGGSCHSHRSKKKGKSDEPVKTLSQFSRDDDSIGLHGKEHLSLECLPKKSTRHHSSKARTNSVVPSSGHGTEKLRTRNDHELRKSLHAEEKVSLNEAALIDKKKAKSNRSHSISTIGKEKGEGSLESLCVQSKNTNSDEQKQSMLNIDNCSTKIPTVPQELNLNTAAHGRLETATRVKTAQPKDARLVADNKNAFSTPTASGAFQNERLNWTFDFLNLNPFKNDKLDEDKFLEAIKKEPDLCKTLFLFDALREELYPLHIVTILNASVKCVKACYKVHPRAFDRTGSIGSPLHMACYFSTLEVVKMFAKKECGALSQINSIGHTPLHIACERSTNPEIVFFLTAKHPDSGKIADNSGSTPLHLACRAKAPRLKIIEDLTEVCPEAGTIRDKGGQTPLLDAIELDVDPAILLDLIVSNPKSAEIRNRNGTSALQKAIEKGYGVPVLKELISAYPQALTLKDCVWRIPLHVAVERDAPLDVVQLLVNRNPDTVELENGRNEIAFTLAQRLGRPGAIVEFLNPFEEVEEELDTRAYK